MKEIHEFPESLNTFKQKESHDATFELYNTLREKNQLDDLTEFCNYFKNIFYIRCFDFKIDDRKDYPEIYTILKRYEHTANWQALELLIWEFNEESMARARKKTEEYRGIYEPMWIKVNDPMKYQHIIGFFWWSSWRACQEIIRDLKQYHPDKITRIIIK